MRTKEECLNEARKAANSVNIKPYLAYKEEKIIILTKDKSCLNGIIQNFLAKKGFKAYDINGADIHLAEFGELKFDI